MFSELHDKGGDQNKQVWRKDLFYMLHHVTWWVAAE